MFDNLKILFFSARDMPKLFAFQHRLNSLTFSLFILFGFWPWPNATYSLNGRELNYVEFWLSGMGPSFFLFMVCVVSMCFATAKRKPWSRIAVFAYWSAIIGFVSFNSVTGVIVGVILILIWGLYVFKNSALDEYYSE